MREAKKSVPNQGPSQVKPPLAAASSRALFGVGPGPTGGDAVDPSQGCVPPVAVVTVLPSVVTGPKKIVEDFPSILTSTAVGAAETAAGRMSSASAIAPASDGERLMVMEEPP